VIVDDEHASRLHGGRRRGRRIVRPNRVESGLPRRVGSHAPFIDRVEDLLERRVSNKAVLARPLK
jgi:hypothetical protein